MAETMEQYMSKTRADYGSGIARPKINDKDHFELKGQFLKELRDNTFNGSDHETTPLTYCPPTRAAKKIEEINNFKQEPNETLYQAWERFKELLIKCPQHYLTEMQTRSTETFDGLATIQAQLNNLRREIKKVNEMVYAAQVGCKQCKGPHYTKNCPLKEEAKIHEENYNLIKEIRASTDAAIRNQGALIKTLEIQIGQMSKALQEKGFGSLPSSTETNPRGHVKSISTTVEADMTPIRHIGSS
ncbi:zf-CCHC domain-containing protein [Tanacetum coccineum]